MGLEEKDFEDVASNTLAGDTPKAIGALVKVLATAATAHPLLGVIFGEGSEALARAVLDSATARFKEAGQKYEDDVERDRHLASLIRESIRPLLVSLSSGISTVGEQQTEQFLQLITYMRRNVASQEKQDLSYALLERIATELAEARNVQAPRATGASGGCPSIAWSCRVGIQAWRNQAVVAGNDLLVTSSGSLWNQADELDGICCLDTRTGQQRWFAPTPADANELLVSKGVALTGCDDGTIVAVLIRDGKVRWRRKLDAAVVGGPLPLQAEIGNDLASTNSRPDEPILVVTYTGLVEVLDLRTGTLLAQHDLQSKVLAPPTRCKARWNEHVLVPSVEGKLFVLEYIAYRRELRMVGEIPVSLDIEDTWRCHASARPVVSGGIIVQGVAGLTYDRKPPLVAYDAVTHARKWVADLGDQPPRSTFGNLRSAPVVIENEIIFAAAYTRGLAAVSLSTGRLLWELEVGRGMFEQWASLTAAGQYVYLGRHDGYLHKIDTAARKRIWSIFLGDEMAAGGVILEDQVIPELQLEYAWQAGGSSPILAAPALDGRRIYVGTNEGFIFAIDEA